jgi:S-adenosylmethionine:tRNA ribosyltransferase-isomerase
LPERLIAETPIKERDHSRLLVLDKKSGKIEHKHFFILVEYLNAGDCLVVNDTKVLPARLFGNKKDTKTLIEILLLKRIDDKKVGNIS